MSCVCIASGVIEMEYMPQAPETLASGYTSRPPQLAQAMHNPKEDSGMPQRLHVLTVRVRVVVHCGSVWARQESMLDCCPSWTRCRKSEISPTDRSTLMQNELR
jgi:hypothetical protein